MPNYPTRPGHNGSVTYVAGSDNTKKSTNNSLDSPTQTSGDAASSGNNGTVNVSGNGVSGVAFPEFNLDKPIVVPGMQKPFNIVSGGNNMLMYIIAAVLLIFLIRK